MTDRPYTKITEIEQDGIKYVNIYRAMELSGVSRRTLYNWMNAGKVKYREAAGGQRWIEYDSIKLKEVVE